MSVAHRRPCARRLRTVCAALALAPLGAAALSAAEGDDRPRLVERGAPDTPHVFERDVRGLPAPPRWKPGDPIREIPRRFYPEPGRPPLREYRPGPDPLVGIQLAEPAPGISSFATTSRNFPGQGYTGVNPPDTVGDAGPAHYIQMINSVNGAIVAIYDKTEPLPALVASFTLDQLGSGVCAGGLGDPVVLYDGPADRWLLSEFSSSGNNLCVYVSRTGDPVSGGWFAYGFTAPAFPDYPKYAVWPTDARGGAGSYIVTANDGGPGIYALDRGAMLSGAPATYQRVSIPGLPGFGFEAPTPADLDGADAPPARAPAIIARHRDTEVHGGPAAPGDLLEMWSFQVDWVEPASSVLVTEPPIDVADFDSDLCGLTSFFCFPQPGTATTLDPLREVIMHRLQYRNRNGRETLVGNFVVDVDGTDHGGIRWFELERGPAGWALKQEGTYAIDGDHRWMGSIAMDQSGNIALGYNVSSTTTWPSLRYTGRADGAPAGVMSEPESVIHAGTAANASNRYGDYAALSVDPSDDCTFWFTGMDNTSASWRTQIASFRFDICGCEVEPAPPVASAAPNGDNRIDVSWDDSELAAVVEYAIERARAPAGPYETRAVVPDSSPGAAGGPPYVFEDSGVSGGITYYYRVRAGDGAVCESDPSNVAAATAVGPCILSPVFAGLAQASTPYSAVCTLALDWSPALAECGGPVHYDVYRSTTAGFAPGPASLLASGVPDTTYVDADGLITGETYHYVVRAVDESNSLTENNSVQRSGRPLGPLASGTWLDDAGDAAPPQMIATAPWSIAAGAGLAGSAAYRAGNYPDGVCAALTTPTLRLHAGGVLSFYSHYDIEAGWDKGEVQISLDGGASWQRVPVSYPGSSTNVADACGLPAGTYFTGTDGAWAPYTADLSPWAERDVRLRFVLSTDASISGSGWWIDDIAISQVDVPGTCATDSACSENPRVDVVPDGPITDCVGSTVLTAGVSGGQGPFTFQWTRDGVDLSGATGSTYTPRDLGSHVYDCRVQAAGCPGPVLDGHPSAITLEDAPRFAGIRDAVAARTTSCAVSLGWDPATTTCDGPLTYYVYRDTVPGVAATAENLVVSGLGATSWVDGGALVDGQTYHYLVRALDRSTGRFDANVAEASAAPTGPGSGTFVAFADDFTDPATFSAWSASVQPASRTCGLWSRSSSALARPSGGAGFYAVSDGSPCGNARTSTAIVSPPIDLTLPGLRSVHLDYDLYYEFQDGGDDAVIEAWDGAAWRVLWTDANSDFDGHHTFDVTPFAAGNPAFRVRLRYGPIDAWLAFDDFVVTVDVLDPCTTRVGPAPVPDGAAAGSPLRADRLTDAGDTIRLTWDAATCPAAGYNLLYGALSGVATYTVSGAICNLGPTGSFTWNGAPPGDLFFLAVGTDGAGTESSWGTDSLLGERNGIATSGFCQVATKDVSATCP